MLNAHATRKPSDRSMPYHIYYMLPPSVVRRHATRLHAGCFPSPRLPCMHVRPTSTYWPPYYGCELYVGSGKGVRPVTPIALYLYTRTRDSHCAGVATTSIASYPRLIILPAHARGSHVGGRPPHTMLWLQSTRSRHEVTPTGRETAPIVALCAYAGKSARTGERGRPGAMTTFVVHGQLQYPIKIFDSSRASQGGGQLQYSAQHMLLNWFPGTRWGGGGVGLGVQSA